MSKFNAVIKKIEEALPVQQNQPVSNTQQANQQPVQQQAVAQAAKLLNMDPKVLQQILDAQKQQAKPGVNANQNNTQQPVP